MAGTVKPILFPKGKESEAGTVHCRIMTPDDYQAVFDLWLHTPGMGLNTTDDSEEGITRYLRRNPTTSFVAEEDGRIVGVIMAGHDGRRGFIHHTAVRPEYRGRHVAEQLVGQAMRALEKEQIHKTALVVFTENRPGNGFWEHMGFTAREDLVYRNRNIDTLEKIGTGGPDARSIR